MNNPHLDLIIRNCEEQMQVIREELETNGILSTDSVKKLTDLCVKIKALRQRAIHSMILAGQRTKDIALTMAVTPSYVSQQRKLLTDKGLL